MKEAIEVYVKIVMATFGFVAPSFTLLISIYIEGIEKKRAKNEEEIGQLEGLIRSNLSKPSNVSGNLELTMKNNLKVLQNKKKKATQELNLLNPKRQVKRLFSILAGALLFIALYYIERCPELSLNLWWLKLITLIISGLFFSWSVYVLWQLFCTIIEVKKSLISESKAVVLQPSDAEEDEVTVVPKSNPAQNNKRKNKQNG